MSRGGDHWFKFYSDDWLDDTRALALEQRGAYIDLIALQMRHGCPLPDNADWLAHKLHISRRKVRPMVDQLLAAGMIKRQNGQLSNSRCEREISERAAQRQVISQSASNREQAKRDSRSTGAPVDDDPKRTGAPIGNESDPNQLSLGAEFGKNPKENNASEARACSGDPPTHVGGRPEEKKIENKKEPLPTPAGGSDVLLEFEAFWHAYPGDAPPRGHKNKTDKPKALEVFRRIISNTHRKCLHAKAETIITAAKRYRETDPNPKYIPKPTNWLNDGRWVDCSEGPVAAQTAWWEDPDKLAEMTLDRWRSDIEQFANGTWPVGKLGPPPGHHRCITPQVLIEELRLTERYTPQGISRERH